MATCIVSPPTRSTLPNYQWCLKRMSTKQPPAPAEASLQPQAQRQFHRLVGDRWLRLCHLRIPLKLPVHHIPDGLTQTQGPKAALRPTSHTGPDLANRPGYRNLRPCRCRLSRRTLHHHRCRAAVVAQPRSAALQRASAAGVETVMSVVVHGHCSQLILYL